MKRRIVEFWEGILLVSPQSMKSSQVNKQDIKILGPFKLLPNVRHFSIRIRMLDKFWNLLGIRKRLKPIIKIYPYKNRQMNRYLIHQLRRMHYKERKVFWRMADHLIKKSDVFLCIAINHVIPKWSRNLNVNSIIPLAKRVRRVANEQDAKLIYKRIYIEKANGGIRDLGVPSPVWRIYLHMMNQLLVLYLEKINFLKDEQPGFRPHRGTMTAWQMIL